MEFIDEGPPQAPSLVLHAFLEVTVDVPAPFNIMPSLVLESAANACAELGFVD